MTSFEPTAWQIPVDDAAVDDLRRRLRQTRWPDEVNDPSWGWGTDQAFLRDLVKRWVAFDWGARAAELNTHPHFQAEIDGYGIHFLHLPSPDLGASRRVPLLLLHGWPGSFAEMLALMPALRVAERAHHIALDVVIPSMPGFGYSARPALPGTSPQRVASLFHQLMTGLGHGVYAIQGGDIGAGVATRMALTYPASVMGIHVNFPAFGYAFRDDESVDDEDREFARKREQWAREEGGYQHIHATRPQTLGYALSDSPVGLAAWIIEKFHAWTDREGQSPGVPIPMEEVLTNLSIYWFSESITSSMRMYREGAADPLLLSADHRIDVPVAVAAFPHELPIQPRSRVARVADLRRWTDMPRGGHFAALEAPDLLSEDVVTFLAGLAPA